MFPLHKSPLRLSIDPHVLLNFLALYLFLLLISDDTPTLSQQTGGYDLPPINIQLLQGREGRKLHEDQGPTLLGLWAVIAFPGL